jgi:hypothetical protein
MPGKTWYRKNFAKRVLAVSAGNEFNNIGGELGERRVGRRNQSQFSRSSNSTIEPGKADERKESAQVTCGNDTVSDAVGDPARDQDAIDNTVQYALVVFASSKRKRKSSIS